jgi:hypothetical protein
MHLKRLMAGPDAPSSATASTDAGSGGAQVMRVTRWLAAAIILFLADAAQLLLLVPDRTGELFAWPIDVHVTSFVLGSAYVAGGYYFVRVLLADAWHRVSAGLPAVIVFVWFIAMATALHLDRFTHDGLPFAAWAGIYAIAPFGLPLLYLAQRRAARPPVADAPLSTRLRVLLSCVGGAVVVAATLVFAAPQATIDVWPWTLTPLTARVAAAVVALFGSLWVSVALTGGRTAARIPLEAHAIGLAFLLLAGARGHGEIDWTNPLAAILVVGVAGMVLLDIGVLARGARSRRHPLRLGRRPAQRSESWDGRRRLSLRGPHGVPGRASPASSGKRSRGASRPSR